MEKYIIIGGFILLLSGYIFIKIKINNFKYRAKQTVLGQVGLGSADINAKINEKIEQGVLTKILADYPNFTEKLLKDTFYAYAQSLINKQNNNLMNPQVITNMASDQKLDVMKTMSFQRVSIMGYKPGKISAIVVYANNQEEYQVMINTSVQNNQLFIDSYDSMKGISKGF